LQRHFKNNDDAKVIVQEIEQIIETKVENKITILTTKEDLLKFQVDVEKRFNSMILWVVGTGIGVVGLILSIIKLFIIK
jgi:hypothetical protein